MGMPEPQEVTAPALSQELPGTEGLLLFGCQLSLGFSVPAWWGPPLALEGKEVGGQGAEGGIIICSLSHA